MTKQKRSQRTASLRHERKYAALGCQNIFGVDEAGRGPWAGPVAAGAVCLPLDREDLAKALRGVRDSKETTFLQRQALAETIKSVATAWGIGSASVEEINMWGIVPATRLAMRRAVETAMANSGVQPGCLFIDDMLLPETLNIPQVSLIEGDKRSLSIAAASILAKIWRDALMDEYDTEFPYYGFKQHKGYGTAAHLAALKQYGPCPIHRQSFQPIRNFINESPER